MVTVLALPSDCIISVFSFLSFDNLRTVALVCKSFEFVLKSNKLLDASALSVGIDSETFLSSTLTYAWLCHKSMVTPLSLRISLCICYLERALSSSLVSFNEKNGTVLFPTRLKMKLPKLRLPDTNVQGIFLISENEWNSTKEEKKEFLSIWIFQWMLVVLKQIEKFLSNSNIRAINLLGKSAAKFLNLGKGDPAEISLVADSVSAFSVELLPEFIDLSKRLQMPL